MRLKNLFFFILIFFIFSGCQTIKEKSDDVDEKELQTVYDEYTKEKESK